MRISKLLPLLALTVLSCSKAPRESGGLMRHSITAGLEGMTKTQLDPSDAAKVQWTARETVDVWVGETSYVFTGRNASAAASATFEYEGDVPGGLDSWVLVSPQGAASSKSGSVITATLPDVQTAVADSYDPQAALIAGLGEGSSVTCKHLYSGIRFKVTESGIKSVSLRGNAGEKIAGAFTFSFSEGYPVITGGTSQTIVLNGPFTPGNWYYILCLPSAFSQGITLTAHNSSQVGSVSTDTETTFTRARLKSRENLIMDSWQTAGNAGTVYYGTANSLCLETGGSLSMDVHPRLITAHWQRSGISTASADTPASAEVLWGDERISSASVTDGRLTLTASASPGSALVAVKKGDTILWSFLVWVKNDITETTLPNGKKLLPPLGDDCYFQWGRKDPLLSSASRLENTYHGLAGATAHPTAFIKGVTSAYDWLCQESVLDQDATLWGGTSGPKTVWDPCPQGYRVPSEADYTHAAITVDYIDTPANGFLELGFLNRNEFYGSARTYWTRSVNQSNSTALDNRATQLEDPVFYGISRDYAIPIRCVKE